MDHILCCWQGDGYTSVSDLMKDLKWTELRSKSILVSDLVT